MMGESGMRIWWTGLLAVLLTWGGGAQADEDMSVASAINKAGRQRMLSQRIVKTYAQIGLGVTPQISRAQLKAAIGQFDLQLAELRAFAPNARMRQSVDALDLVWRPFRQAAEGEVTRANAERLAQMDESVMQAANGLTLALQNYAGMPTAWLVNDSGRLRMLSQRLAKLYMLRAWQVDSPALRRQFDEARTEFETRLLLLQEAPQNTYAINRELEVVVLQWAWFRAALEQDAEHALYRVVVADAVESMLRGLETVTRLYEELPSGR